jgi:hypothetical protein
MQLDVWMPSLNIGIEYQGVQHYFDSRFVSDGEDGIEKRREKDEEKYRICEEIFVKILHVPFWWNLREDYLNECVSSLLIE